jgi:CBS-domain-containing membrane protein
MSLIDYLKKERTIWHKRFIPSLIAGISVAIITFFFEMTASNIVMFASLGASAAILTQKQIHKLTILRTVILSYLIALIISLIVSHIPVSFPIAALLVVTLTTIGLYLFDIFHPPAISAALAFIMINGGIWEDITIFIAVIILLIIVKILTYAFYYENLEMHKFFQELKDINKEDVKKIKKILKK